MVLGSIFVFGPVLAAFPQAALGGVVVYAGLRLIDIGELRRIARFRRSEVVLALITFAAVLATGLLNGIGIAVGLSLLDLIRRIAHPHDGVTVSYTHLDVYKRQVWRTGGLEAAVALHVCNNMISEITLPFGGLAEMFDRGAGTAGPETLIQMFFTAAVTGAMIWLGRRLRLPMSTAPGSSGRPPSFAGAE